MLILQQDNLLFMLFFKKKKFKYLSLISVKIKNNKLFNARNAIYFTKFQWFTTNLIYSDVLVKKSTFKILK